MIIAPAPSILAPHLEDLLNIAGFSNQSRRFGGSPLSLTSAGAPLAVAFPTGAGVGADEAPPLPLPVDEADALALPVALGILGLAGAGADEATPLLLVPGSLWLVD